MYKLDEKVVKLLQAHIPREAGASNQYLAMALWAKGKGYMNTAAWLKKAAHEETEHRDAMLEFLNDFGICDGVPACQERKCAFKDLPDLFAQVGEMELKVTNYINEMVDAALAAKDHIARRFLEGFVDEQSHSLREVADIQAVLTAGAAVNRLEFDEWMGED